MTDHRTTPHDPKGALRRRAEKQVARDARHPTEETARSPEEHRALVHELKVHQLELEMQNEELGRSQLELDAARLRYFNLFDAAPVGYCTTSSEGLILEVNHTAASMLNLPPAELVGAPLSGLIFRADQDVLYLHHKALAASGKSCTCELRMNRRDAPAFWVQVTSVNWQDAEGATFCRVAFSDISARKRAEVENDTLRNQLHENRKLESIGRLAGGVAHEFNNMLGVIIGNAELAQGEVDPQSQIGGNLQEILNASRRSADVTRQLLAYARMEICTPKMIDLNLTVETTLRMVRRLISPEIELDFRPARELWWVRMDPSQINQILVNLCLNARDAITGPGRITVETGNVFFSSQHCERHPGSMPGDFVLLSVRDDGCGLDEQARENLYEPFFTTKKLGHGTGLGLAAVSGIVAQNSGTIEYASEPGSGTIFRVHLPRYIRVVESPPAPERRIPDAETGTILLVDDEPAVLQMTKRMLERLGYTVLPAAHPEEAFGLAQTYPGRIHLLLTDVVLPGENGMDLARRLLVLSPHLKPMFMSGYLSELVDDHAMMEAGARFIRKPFSMKDLAGSVRQALRGDPLV